MNEFRAIAPPAEVSLGERARRLWRREAESVGLRNYWRDPLLRRLLASADLIAASLAVVTFGFAGGTSAGFWAIVLLPGWILLAKFFSLYDRDQRALRHLTADEIGSIFLWSLTATAATTIFVLLVPGRELGLKGVVAAGIVAALAAVMLRSTARSLWRYLTPPEQTLIVGGGALADAVGRKLEIFRDIHIQLSGRRDTLSVATLRSNEDALAGVDRVILASTSISEVLLTELLKVCRRDKIKLSLIPPMRGMFGTAVSLDHVADLPVIAYNTWDVSRSSLLLKRIVDVTVALAALILLAPVLVVVAICTALTGGPGPVVYAQTRAGKDGEPFRMYKFRTMVCDAEERLADLISIEELEEPVFKLRDDPRVTRIGRFLRRTSIDEMPQLVNVLKGEMSLVGPRPEQLDIVARYRPEHQFRLAVKPGITGPMQVFGRGGLGFDERLAVEREYIENLSVGRDLRILALTLAAVVRGEGAY